MTRKNVQPQKMKPATGKTLKRQQAHRKLRVMAEYGSSGIWLIQQVGMFRHGEIDHSALRLPQELAHDFERWIAEYEDRYGAPTDYIAFNAEGRRLAQALKRHLGEAASVEFQPETAEGGIGPAEEILLSEEGTTNDSV